jgi:hypothetical protein
MSKFLETINIKVDTEYHLNEKVVNDGNLGDRLQSLEEVGGYNFTEGDPETAEEILQTGGRFDWGIYQAPDDPQGLVRVQLMRLWCVQMFVQIAKGKAFTNEADAGVDVILTDDELKHLESIANKVYTSLHKELDATNEAIVVKRKPKKLEF